MKEKSEKNSESCMPKSAGMTDVGLPAELNGLIEALAENVHDTWAKGRVDDGWVYGSARDDIKKQHPCLIPYSELPESEKEYDRNTAIATLRFIVKNGYRICMHKDETDIIK